MLIWPAEEPARAKFPHAVTHTACHEFLRFTMIILDAGYDLP